MQDLTQYKTTLENKYIDLKLEYNDAVIWFFQNDFVQTMSSCAIKTSNVLSTVLTHRPDNNLELTGFDANYLHDNLTKMIKDGHKVCLVELSSNKPNKLRKTK